MTGLRPAVVFLLLATPVAAQEPESPLAAIQRLFAAMQQQDTAAMRAAMHTTMRLVATGTDQQGQPTARSVPLDAWLRSIGGAPARLDEKIHDPEVRIDGDLATVWTRYDFFLGERFSHCGYDSFQLVRVGGNWRIGAVADTQRRAAELCGRAPAAAPPPVTNPADTAAVIAAVQKLFDGMLARDSAALRAVFTDDAHLLALGSGAGSPRSSAAREWIPGVVRASGGALRERMYQPEVRISDNLATLWTYYDFHIGDEFSHCGIDAAQLVRTAGGWKIAQISYTVRRNDCHPPASVRD